MAWWRNFSCFADKHFFLVFNMQREISRPLCLEDMHSNTSVVYSEFYLNLFTSKIPYIMIPFNKSLELQHGHGDTQTIIPLYFNPGLANAYLMLT